MGFAGHGIQQVARALASLKKDEYESTSAHSERLRSALNDPSHPLANRRLCFMSEEVTQYPTAHLDYDADRQAFLVSPPLLREELVGPWSGTYLLIETVELRRGRYEGTNHFGATAMITDVEKDEYKLRLPRFREPVAIHVAPAAAKAAHPHLRLLAIGALRPPFLLQRPRHKSATISSPVEVNATENVLDMDIAEFVLIDSRSGAVVGRHAFNMPEPVDLFEDAPAAPGPTASMLSARLIRSLLAIGTSQAAEDAFALACLREMPADAFAGRIQELLPEHFNRDLLMQLDAFYASPAGVRHADRVFHALEGPRPLLLARPERITRAERAHLREAISPDALPFAIGLMTGRPEGLFEQLLPVVMGVRSACRAP